MKSATLSSYSAIFFAGVRETKHINRIISCQYLFRKTVMQSTISHPDRRHLSVKLFRTKLHTAEKQKPVLGILATLNLIKENELFEDRHLLKSIQSCIPGAEYVKNSHITDRRATLNLRTLYLEVQKKDEAPFTSEEIKEAQKRLPQEIKSRIESPNHPIFMYRNEEEIIRNILILSKQLKYVHDLPQVIVSFEKQTETEIAFTVILLRLTKPNDKPLKNIFQEKSTPITFIEQEVKIVGILRKKYPKEANVFEVRMDKRPFLRKDSSLDLYKSREKVVQELSKLVGEVRDFNGGMIAKQNEVLVDLKKLLRRENIRNDFLLENFFYSLTPSYMQSLLTPQILKEFFQQVLHIIEMDYNKASFYIESKVKDDYYLLLTGSTHLSFRDYISKEVKRIAFSPSEITTSSLSFFETHLLGYIIRYNEPSDYKSFHKAVLEGLAKWEKKVQCNLPAPAEFSKAFMRASQ